MERRYRLLAEHGVRGIDGYNQAHPERRLPYVVVVIDELADLMLVARRDVEDSLTRLAQMARAAGIHLLVATQRPSVDVLTGIIKANFPARISFQVSSRTDSRTILDSIGAERLLGKGDMLFLPPGTSKLLRIHGAYVSEAEIKRLVDYLRTQQAPVYDFSIFTVKSDEQVETEEFDDKYDEAVALVARLGHASASLIQRHLRIGYNRAARLIEVMEREGVVGPADGSRAREVYVKEIPEPPFRA
jgi:S-DNA-T family DNA segregation ATPase FtsK/SpoIIIE